MVSLYVVLSLFVLFTTLTETLGSEECVKEHNFDYYGDDIPQPEGGVTSANNADECAAACEQNEECNFWTYATFCYMKYTNSGRRYKYGAISGNKACGKDSQWLSTDFLQELLDENVEEEAEPEASGSQRFDADARGPLPCRNYTELSDAWRHMFYINTNGRPRFTRDQTLRFCDADGVSVWRYHTNLAWGTWFRFTGAAGNKLPTAPAPDKRIIGSNNNGIRRCGTGARAWIKGGNPTIQDGIVTRDVCFEYGFKSCKSNTTVGVAACRDMHGDFFVYQLQPVPSCMAAYCAID